MPVWNLGSISSRAYSSGKRTGEAPPSPWSSPPESAVSGGTRIIELERNRHDATDTTELIRDTTHQPHTTPGNSRNVTNARSRPKKSPFQSPHRGARKPWNDGLNTTSRGDTATVLQAQIVDAVYRPSRVLFPALELPIQQVFSNQISCFSP